MRNVTSHNVYAKYKLYKLSWLSGCQQILICRYTNRVHVGIERSYKWGISGICFRPSVSIMLVNLIKSTISKKF